MRTLAAAALLVASPVLAGPPQDFYYHADDMNHTAAISDPLGAPVERYECADYGAPAFFDALGAPLTSSVAGNPYLFTGRRYEPESALYDFRTRYLDPAAAQFTVRDSIGIWGDASNRGRGQAYAAGNPTSRIDPLGTIERDPRQINCIGFATGENAHIRPEAGKESLKQMLEMLGWSCTKTAKSKDCECPCDSYMIMVYIYRYQGMKDPFGDAWQIGPDRRKPNDFHGVRCKDEPTGDPKTKYKCAGGWHYVPQHYAKVRVKVDGKWNGLPADWADVIARGGPEADAAKKRFEEHQTKLGKKVDAYDVWTSNIKNVEDADQAKPGGTGDQSYCCCKKK